MATLSDDPFEDMQVRSTACNTCAHVFPGYAFCEAFPDGEGIPWNIITGHNDHLTEVEGDHGVRYLYAPELGPKPSFLP